MNEYDNLVEITKNTEFELVEIRKGMHMKKHVNPVSISRTEFDFIKNFIIDNNLKKGYDVATAFGISMLAAGLGFKETGGKLVTMDCYIEEQFNGCMSYDGMYNQTYQNSDGFKTASFLINHFELNDIVRPTVGFSPIDTAKVIIDTHIDQKLDYALIDAFHTEEAVIQDIEAVIPFLSDKFVIFLHDVHCFNTGMVEKHLIEKFGKSWTAAPNCEHPGEGYNLSFVNNL
jgi:hypothetical protein